MAKKGGKASAPARERGGESSGEWSKGAFDDAFSEMQSNLDAARRALSNGRSAEGLLASAEKHLREMREVAKGAEGLQEAFCRNSIASQEIELERIRKQVTESLGATESGMTEKALRREYVEPFEKIKNELQRLEKVASKGKLEEVRVALVAIGPQYEEAKINWELAVGQYSAVAEKVKSEVNAKNDAIAQLQAKVEAAVERVMAAFEAKQPQLAESFDALYEETKQLKERFDADPLGRGDELDQLQESLKALGGEWNQLLDNNVPIHTESSHRVIDSNKKIAQMLQQMYDEYDRLNDAREAEQRAQPNAVERQDGFTLEDAQELARDTKDRLENLIIDIQTVLGDKAIPMGELRKSVRAFRERGEAIQAEWAPALTQRDAIGDVARDVHRLGYDAEQLFNALDHDLQVSNQRIDKYTGELRQIHSEIDQDIERIRALDAGAIPSADVQALEARISAWEVEFQRIKSDLYEREHRALARAGEHAIGLLQQLRAEMARLQGAPERVRGERPVEERADAPYRKAFGETVQDASFWNTDDIRQRGRVLRALVERGGRPKNKAIVKDAKALFVRAQELRALRPAREEELVVDAVPDEDEQQITAAREAATRAEARGQIFKSEETLKDHLLSDEFWKDGVPMQERERLLAASNTPNVELKEKVKDVSRFRGLQHELQRMRRPFAMEEEAREPLYSEAEIREVITNLERWQAKVYKDLHNNFYWKPDVSAEQRTSSIQNYDGKGENAELKEKLADVEAFTADIRLLRDSAEYGMVILDEVQSFKATGDYAHEDHLKQAVERVRQLVQQPIVRDWASKVIPVEAPPVEAVPVVETGKDVEKRRFDLLSDPVFWEGPTGIQRKGQINKLMKGEKVDEAKLKGLHAPVEFKRALQMQTIEELRAYVEKLRADEEMRSEGLLGDVVATADKESNLLTDLQAAETEPLENRVWFDEYFTRGIPQVLVEREAARVEAPEPRPVVPVRRPPVKFPPVPVAPLPSRRPEPVPHVAAPEPVIIDVPERPIEAEVKVSGFARRVMDRFRGWFGGREAQSAVELTRAQFTGEKTTQEREGGEMTKADKTLRITGALVGAGLSIVGLKSMPDIVRYLSQRLGVRGEQKDLQVEIAKAFDASHEITNREHIADDIRAQRNAEAAVRLHQTIEKSKYLTNEQKRDLIGRLQARQADYATRSDWNKQERDREIAAILEKEITTRISATTLAKESANTLVMAPKIAAYATGTAVAVGGVYTVRALVYGAASMIERMKKTGGNDLWTVQNAKKAFSDGFAEWKEKITSGRRVSQAEAIGTLARVVGIGGLAVNEIVDALPSFESLQLHGDIDGPAVEAVTTEATLEVQKKVDQILDAPDAADAWTQTDASVVEPWMDTEMSSVTGPAVTLPEDYRFLDPETLRLASVQNGDGITQVLARQIEANPATFGFSGDADDLHLFAVKKALAIAKLDGLDSSWLRAETAVGHVAIVPEVRGGEVHAIFRDVQTGNEIPLEELRERGITMKGR